jgi:hypothetical protein
MQWRSVHLEEGAKMRPTALCGRARDTPSPSPRIIKLWQSNGSNMTAALWEHSDSGALLSIIFLPSMMTIRYLMSKIAPENWAT